MGRAPSRGTLSTILHVVVVFLITLSILFRVEESLWAFVPCRVAGHALWGCDVCGPVRCGGSAPAACEREREGEA